MEKKRVRERERNDKEKTTLGGGLVFFSKWPESHGA